jgi:hypothetical protein
MCSSNTFLERSNVRLVFVHGRDQQGKDPQDLREIWLRALEEGLAKEGLPGLTNVEVVLPYYGDTLADIVSKLHDAPPSDLRTKGDAGLVDRVNEAQNEILRELLGPEDLVAPDGQIRSKGLQNTKLALAAARLADASPFRQNLLKRFTEDVAIYLTVDRVGKVVDDIVNDAIGTQPCVVVGHSLGSVVAYRVLRDMGARANALKFVTIGSPLGLTAIRKRLIPPALQHPAGVKSWFNAYDTRDIVSLYPLDATTWPIKPSITNCSSVSNHTNNRHSINGYLDDAVVARAIHEGLGQQATSVETSANVKPTA